MSRCDDPQDAVLTFLADPGAHGLSEPVKRIDTAGAIVFLAGPDVYKVKRAVKYPYMDLSTLEKRRAACESEIAVNRDNAPAIYLGVIPIVRMRDGLRLGGEGDAVEWAVHMRRFDEDATLDRVAERGDLTPEIIDKLAAAIRRSHARAPRRDAVAATGALETYLDQNDAAFAERPQVFPAAEARRLGQDTRLAFAVARPTLLARGAMGLVARRHGDLHLKNVALIDGEPVLFDAIEFSDEIAAGDVLYDLAFLLMDLEMRGLRRAGEPAVQPLSRARAARGAERARGAALVHEPARRHPGEGRGGRRRPAGGNEARRSAAGLRAAISISRARCSPTIRRGSSPSAAFPARARARSPASSRRQSAALPGRSGCAATSSARRMFDVAETTPLPAGAYAPEATRAVYERIEDKARRALRAGQAVVLDATFSRAAERVAAGDIAAEIGAPFAGVFLEASLATRLERIGGRKADASDADQAVARRQAADPLRERGWSPLDAEGTLGGDGEDGRWSGCAPKRARRLTAAGIRSSVPG